jgi:integrase
MTMATIRLRKGKYQVQIRKGSYPPQSKTFNTKQEAATWAREAEAHLYQGVNELVLDKSLILENLITRYREQITPQKKGRDQETRRLNLLIRDPISKTKLVEMSPALFARFRDRRLKDGIRTCHYDLVLLRHILKVAKFEWGISLQENPLDFVRNPPTSKPRDRTLAPEEYKSLKAALAGTRSVYLEPLMDLAIQTGMRRGELLKIKWQDLDLEERTLQLYDTKNGEDRKVPLTTTAASILTEWSSSSKRIFPITSVAVRQSWDRLVKRAGISNLHFHDLRHEAISRFLEMGLSVPEVALISGHKDPRMLFRYTHLRAEDVVRKLK